MSTILVTGATGNVGSRLIKRLTAKGAKVRAFVRASDTAKLPAGVEAFTGDLADRERVRAAVKGVSKVFLLSAGTNLTALEANVIDAASAEKVSHLVKQSTQGAQYEGPLFAKWHRASEKRIEASGVAFTFLRPASIATNALEWAGMIKNGGTVYGPYGASSLPVVDPDDIAAVAEKALTESGHSGKAYELTGPESLTIPEQLAVIGKVIGKKLSYVDVPDEAATQSMIGMGMPKDFVEAIVDLAKALRAVGKIPPTGTVNEVLGRPPRSFEQFIRDNAAVFG